MVWGQVEVEVEVQVENTFDRVSGSTAHMVAIAKVGRPCDGASWEQGGAEEEEE